MRIWFISKSLSFNDKKCGNDLGSIVSMAATVSILIAEIFYGKHIHDHKKYGHIPLMILSILMSPFIIIYLGSAGTLFSRVILHGNGYLMRPSGFFALMGRAQIKLFLKDFQQDCNTRTDRFSYAAISSGFLSGILYFNKMYHIDSNNIFIHVDSVALRTLTRIDLTIFHHTPIFL